MDQKQSCSEDIANNIIQLADDAVKSIDRYARHPLTTNKLSESDKEITLGMIKSTIYRMMHNALNYTIRSVEDDGSF